MRNTRVTTKMKTTHTLIAAFLHGDETMRHFDMHGTLLIVAVLLMVQGCASAPTRLEAVPSALTAKAEIPGMPGVRYVAGGRGESGRKQG